jgi:hypothetical protein
VKELLDRPLPRLVAVVALQFLVLLAIIGFKQYTIATADTIVIATDVRDPSTIVGRDSAPARYEISSLDAADLPGDDLSELPGGGDSLDNVYVELREGTDGVWHPVAVHDDRDRMFDGTVLIAGRIEYASGRPGSEQFEMHYGIERVFIPENAAGGLPAGSGHEVNVEVRVDRFGHSDALEFVVDGKPFELERR